MPLYEYFCPHCREKTESVSTSWRTRPDRVECDYCGYDAIRIMSAPATFCAPDKRKVYHMLSDTPMNYQEKKQYMRQNKLVEAGDSIGGSKDEMLKTCKAQNAAGKAKKADAERKEFINKQVSKFHTSGKKIGQRKYDD